LTINSLWQYTTRAVFLGLFGYIGLLQEEGVFTRTLLACVCLSALARGAFGQHGGTLTGVIADPTGAVVGSASIQVKNSETGAVFHGGSSATGNYTLALSPGIYELSVTVAGFRKHIRENLELPAAITVRWDVMLVVGVTSEAFTVTGSTPLL
jgi:hypothetical protein